MQLKAKITEFLFNKPRIPTFIDLGRADYSIWEELTPAEVGEFVTNIHAHAADQRSDWRIAFQYWFAWLQIRRYRATNQLFANLMIYQNQNLAVQLGRHSVTRLKSGRLTPSSDVLIACHILSLASPEKRRELRRKAKEYGSTT